VITTPAARRYEVRHVQLARAVIAAIAAVIVTFSPDHSAAVGLSIFSGFALTTGVALLAAGWLVYPVDTRWQVLAMGVLSVVAGLVAGIPQLRSETMFFVTLVSWALATGIIEAIGGARGLRASRGRPKTDAARTESRDALTVGILTTALGVGLLLVPAGYALRYTIDEANATYTLTGIIIAVGIFGAYAAIIGVYLAIAGFSPRKSGPVARTAAESSPDARTEVTADLRGAPANDERGTA
jgi:uncharacterized membrane protein HdeD (DUF308 family)